MTQIATTIEQSKHLLELGLDSKSADMCLCKSTQDTWFLCAYTPGSYDAHTVPAWSLSALLEVMPKELVNDGYNKKGEQVVALTKLVIDTFVVDGRYIWRIGYKGKRRYWIKIYGYNLIRAAFEMDCFLLRQCYITKGGAS
jgi:hypothetical protein